VCGHETVPSPLRRRLGNGVVSRLSEGGIGKGVGEERRGGRCASEGQSHATFHAASGCSVTLVGHHGGHAAEIAFQRHRTAQDR